MNYDTRNPQFRADLKLAINRWIETDSLAAVPPSMRACIEADYISKPILYFRREPTLHGSTVSLTFRILHLDPNDQKPRNYNDEIVNGLYFNDLVLEVLIWRYDYQEKHEIHKAINYEYYQPYHVTLETSKLMNKTLSYIDRRMNQFNKEWGFIPQSDIKMYVRRFCKALGIKEFYQPHNDNCSTYTENTYFNATVSEIDSAIDNFIYQTEKILGA